jgi:hypothetical protein
VLGTEFNPQYWKKKKPIFKKRRKWSTVSGLFVFYKCNRIKMETHMTRKNTQDHRSDSKGSCSSGLRALAWGQLAQFQSSPSLIPRGCCPRNSWNSAHLSTRTPRRPGWCWEFSRKMQSALAIASSMTGAELTAPLNIILTRGKNLSHGAECIVLPNVPFLPPKSLMNSGGAQHAALTTEMWQESGHVSSLGRTSRVSTHLLWLFFPGSHWLVKAR